MINSTPTTSARLTTPERIIALAVVQLYKKLVQAVLTSIDAAFFAPNLYCNPDALFGTISSKLHEPYTIRSMSVAFSPAQASACIAATYDISMACTCDTRRSFMPVREVIHSSSVSRNVAKSALVSTAGGMHLPQPVIAA